MFHLMKWVLGLTLVLASALSSQAADPVHPGLKPQLNKTPEAMSTEPTPTPQVPGVKTAPGLTAPGPTKQGITAPLGQKASIAVKSPTQGTRHPASKPLPIIWDRSSISTAASVNILLLDKPGGPAKATIKAGAPNTGSFTSWIAPQQYTAAGNSWTIRIETADGKASGHSGSFSFVRQSVSGMDVTPSAKSGVAVQSSAHSPDQVTAPLPVAKGMEPSLQQRAINPQPEPPGVVGRSQVKPVEKVGINPQPEPPVNKDLQLKTQPPLPSQTPDTAFAPQVVTTAELTVSGQTATPFTPRVVTAQELTLTGRSAPAFMPKVTTTEELTLTGRSAPAFQPKVTTTEELTVTGRSAPVFQPKVTTTDELTVTGRTQAAFVPKVGVAAELTITGRHP